MNDVIDVAVETTERVAKGYLNGTTKKQAYGIIAATGLAGMASGVVSTLYVIKKKFVLTKRYAKIDLNDPNRFANGGIIQPDPDVPSMP